jgi:hypothetical protein
METPIVFNEFTPGLKRQGCFILAYKYTLVYASGKGDTYEMQLPR